MLQPPPSHLRNQHKPTRLWMTAGTALAWLAACGPEQTILRTVTATETPAGQPRPDAAAPTVNTPIDATVSVDSGLADPNVDNAANTDGAVPEAGIAGAGTVAPPPAVDTAIALDVLPLPPPLPGDAAVTGTDVVVPMNDAATDAPRERLTVESDQSRAETDLTDVGRLDWLHWGLGNANEPNRKRNATRQVRWSVIGERALGTYGDRPVEFSWSDGVPTGNAHTRQGIAVGSEVGVGYRLRFDGPMRNGGRMLVYAGVWNARAELRVRLRNTDLGTQTRSLDARAPGNDRVFTIDFGPLDDDESVIVEWVTAELHNPAGNVTLQAAAISPVTVGAIEPR